MRRAFVILSAIHADVSLHSLNVLLAQLTIPMHSANVSIDLVFMSGFKLFHQALVLVF